MKAVIKVKPVMLSRRNNLGPVKPKTKPKFNLVKGKPAVEGSETHTGRKHIAPPKGSITLQQRMFVDEWLICRDDGEAARKAGYVAKSSATTGRRLRNHHILVKALIEEKLAIIEQRAIKKADDVLRYIHTAMFYNPVKFFKPGDGGGWLIDEEDFRNLPDWVGCMVEEMQVRCKHNYDGTQTITYWVKLVSKTKMAELAARHQLGDKITVTRVNLNWDDLINAYDPNDPLDMKNDPIEAKLRELASKEPKALSPAAHMVVQGLVELQED